MAAATLNDVTNSLMLLNVEQGNTTEAVKSLVKRVQDMLDFDKRKALDDAEAAREAKNRARSQSQRTSAPSVSSPFGMGDALLAGALLTIAALNDQLRGIFDQATDNFLKFVNDVQKIFFVLNQSLIALRNFVNNQIVARIANLILDFRTDPKLTRITTTIEDSIKFLTNVVDDLRKTIRGTLSVIGSAFRFIASLLRPVVAIFTAGVSEVIVAMNKFEPIFKFLRGIVKIFSKLFLPLTIFITAWDTVKGAVDGFKEEGLVGGIEGAVTGFFNSLIFAPLDLLKEATEWVLKQVGLTSIADALDDFSFQETFTELVGSVFDTLKGAVNWIKTIFTDPKEALQQLWQGLVGEGGLIDIIYAPLNAAVNFIRRIFNLGDPDQPFRMGAFIEGLITQTVDIFAQIFNRFMNMLKSIPVVKEFFKSEEEKALEQRRKALEEEAARLEREIKTLEDDKYMSERRLLLQRKQGGVETIPLGYRTFGESMDQAIERRKAERDAALSTIQNLSAEQLLKRMEAMQTGQMLRLAGQNLSAMQSGVSNTVIDNSTVAPNTTTVNNQMAVPTPVVESERISLD